MNVKLGVFGASALFALGLSLTAIPAAQAGHAPGPAGEIAGKPQPVWGEAKDTPDSTGKPKPKPKVKPKGDKGKNGAKGSKGDLPAPPSDLPPPKTGK